MLIRLFYLFYKMSHELIELFIYYSSTGIIGSFTVKGTTIHEFFLGNTNIGGTAFPNADTAVTIVTLVPHFPEVIAPSLRLPLASTNLFGFGTVDTPVLSTFHICDAHQKLQRNCQKQLRGSEHQLMLSYQGWWVLAYE